MNKKLLVLLFIVIVGINYGSDNVSQQLGIFLIPLTVVTIMSYWRKEEVTDLVEEKEFIEEETILETTQESDIDRMLDYPTWKRQEEEYDHFSQSYSIPKANIDEKPKQEIKKSKRQKKSISKAYLINLFHDVNFRFFTKNSKSKLCFIGSGGGGSNILTDFHQIDDKHKYIHINSDYNALVQKKSEYKILLTSEHKNDKWGCGGNTDCGLGLIDEKVKKTIKQYTEKHEIIYLIATLGGGVGSGSTPEIARYLKELNKKVMIYVTLPFEFEGKNRMTIAHDSLKLLRAHADKLIVFENNTLLQSKKGLRDTFKVMSNRVYSKIV